MAEGGRKLMADEDRLPWLEPVDEDKVDPGIGAGKLAAAVIVALIAIGLLVGGIFWMRVPAAEEGQGDLIAAPATPYKVKPDNPGGMQVPGQGDISYAASEGVDNDAKINTAKLPEEPVERSGKPVAPAATPKAPAKAEPGSTTKVALGDATPIAPPATKATVGDKAPAPVATPAAATASASGPAIQLGAFSSEAKASAAWKAMAKRITYLQPLTMTVQPATVGDKTIYRLRATGPDVKGVCAKLKAAGESCTVM